ncbi:putative ABC transporter permease [Desulfobacterium sp. N47]|uniref:putative ABC transporter permease n=1 Tax=Desulfobacterium sp. N47 TaxID=3115210 RepID=UPI003F49EF59
MKTDILSILFSFSFFSILGWMLEVSYRSFRDKQFVNPGLLKGPYLILYGTGALILMGAVSLFQESHLITKALAYFAVTTGLELISGFIARYFFHVRLWDYSDQRFHYKGHISLKFSIYWILLAFAFEYLISPPYQGILNQLAPVVKGVFAAVTLSIMLVDFLTVSIRSFLSLTPEEKTAMETQFINMANPLIEHPEVAKLSQYEHHRGKTRLEHVKEVAYISFLWGKRLSLDCDSITRGALLHDLFFYDWLREGPRLHGFRHHNIALKNARKITPLTEKEEDIIKKHMWPLTVVPPRYMESLVVSLVDTFCSARDYLRVKNHDKTAKAAAVCVSSDSGDKRV